MTSLLDEWFPRASLSPEPVLSRVERARTILKTFKAVAGFEPLPGLAKEWREGAHALAFYEDVTGEFVRWAIPRVQARGRAITSPATLGSEIGAWRARR